MCQPVYGGVNSTVENILSKMGVETTWVKSGNVQEYRDAVKSNTKVKK